MNHHPDTEDIAAYLNRSLPSAAHSDLEAHLASCRSCRREVISARRLVQAASLRSRWPMIVPAAVAALLALTLAGRAVLVPTVHRPGVRGPAAAAGTEKVPTIPAFSPPEGRSVPVGTVRFTWGGQLDQPLYRLTLTDGSGKALWVRDTGDTTLAVLADVALAPGRTYFWYVDALDANGEALTTGTRRFVIAR
jgi:Putative zinc-finger